MSSKNLDGEEEANENAPARALQMLATNFREPLEKADFPPSEFVCFEDMHEEWTDCKELMERTANSLTEDTFRLLFVSVQQNNIDLCVSNAVQGYTQLDMTSLTRKTLAWFPHVWMEENYEDISNISSNHFNNNRTFADNVARCTSLLKAKYPNLDHTLKRVAGLAEVKAAICICAEQTFSEALGRKKAFF